MGRVYGSRTIFATTAAIQLAILNAVLAQNCGNPTTTQTVNNQADLDAIRDCATYEGSLSIGFDFVDPKINGISEIRGGIESRNGKLQSLEAPDLESIGGVFSIQGASDLATISMPNLSSLRSLVLEDLPNLRKLGFSDDVRGITDRRDVVAAVTIDKTGLESIGELNMLYLERLIVRNNQALDNIHIKAINVTEELVVRNNRPNTNVYLPDLETAGTVDFSDGIRTLAAQNLQSVTSLSLQDNTYTSIAFPQLEYVGLETSGPIGELNIAGSPNLEQVRFSSLATIGSNLNITNTSPWNSIDGFPSLDSVGSGVYITGSFSSIDFPGLVVDNSASTFFVKSELAVCKDIRGAPYITQSTWGLITCNGQSYGLSSTNATTTTPGAAAPTETSTNPTISTVGLGLSIGGIILALIVISVAAWFLIRCHRRKKQRRAAGKTEHMGESMVELRMEHGFKAELPATESPVVELGNTGVINHRSQDSPAVTELENSFVLAELDGTPITPRDPVAAKVIL